VSSAVYNLPDTADCKPNYKSR